jgi:hypothetical protein
MRRFVCMTLAAAAVALALEGVVQAGGRPGGHIAPSFNSVRVGGSSYCYKPCYSGYCYKPSYCYNGYCYSYPSYVQSYYCYPPAYCNNYYLTYGVPFSGGYYYKGFAHKHWSYCYWDSRYCCYLYYDPYLCCYYYWYAPSQCFYPLTYTAPLAGGPGLSGPPPSGPTQTDLGTGPRLPPGGQIQPPPVLGQGQIQGPAITGQSQIQGPPLTGQGQTPPPGGQTPPPPAPGGQTPPPAVGQGQPMPPASN